MNEVSESQDKARRLFEYLKGVSELRSKPIPHIDRYQQAIFLTDLFDDVEEAYAGDADEWFRLRRISMPVRPEAPFLVEGWVEGHELDDWRNTPVLREAIRIEREVEDESGRRLEESWLHRADCPEVDEAWVGYFESWRAWQAECESLAPAHGAYGAVFNAHQQAVQLGEQFELVLCQGLLSWHVGSVRVLRHLLAAPCVVEIDGETGELRVGPDPDAAVPFKFEQEMVPPEHRPQTHDVGDVQERLDEVDGPFDLEAVSGLLRDWVTAAHPDGVFADDNSRHSPSDAPKLSLAPAICLRKRSHQTLSDAYASILDQLDELEELPGTIEDLVSFTGARLDESESLSSNWVPDSGEVFFPLAANDQQRQIIKTLGDRRGLVVQGPPGTGKSQTIANLICHSLSMGKRVLVTSHTERALRVLQEKLPAEFETLTVNVVGEGRSASEDVQRSANALLTRMTDTRFSPASLAGRAREIESQLQSLRSAEADVRGELSQAFATRVSSTEFSPAHYGTAANVLEELVAEQPEHGWFETRVVGDLSVEVVDLQWLCQWIEQSADFDGAQFVPSDDEVPEPSVFAELLGRLESAELNASGVPAANVAVEHCDPGLIRRLVKAVEEHAGAIGRRREGWLATAKREVEVGDEEPWRRLRDLTNSTLRHCRELGEFAHAAPSGRTIEELQGLIHQGRGLDEHLRNGGSLRKRFGQSRQQKDAEAFLALSVDGRPIADLATVEEQVRRLEIELQIMQLERHWAGQLDVSSEPTIERAVASLEATVESLEMVLDYHQSRVALGTALGLVDPEILPAVPAEIAAELDRVAATSDRDEAAQELAALTEAIIPVGEHDAHSSVLEARTALSARDLDGFAAAFNEMASYREQQAEALRAGELRASVEESAPGIVDKLRQDPAQLDDNEGFVSAWNWSLAMGRIEAASDTEFAGLFDKLSSLRDERADFTRELGQVQAWMHAIASLTDAQATHLKAYQGALKRLGKGTGKRAMTHRAEARRHLDQCRDAIPAWIMPSYRVAETMAMVPGAFDVVIVDEASQSGVEDLFLLWLGKQMIIVGDDEQISPSNVGVKDGDVERLIAEHISDFELRDHLDIKHSLFDQAKTRYSGEVWLTEHFRCMPEIIEFSNREVYAPQHRRLEPLRQFGAGRLPPLVSTFVADADEQRSTNEIEALELVNRIVACHDDPAYDGKSFGVISLLSSGRQDEVIQHALFERLGQEAWSERDLRVGNAYDFQGDERDVIFLSMVKAPTGGSRIRKLGAAADKQRYNVATSRARDQLWLFHSVTLDDLNPECLRSKLLRHFLEPSAQGVQDFTEEVDRDRRHPKFDSLFEQRVFCDLRERGFVVEPLVEVYGKRIDLVVAGFGGKLAVECDGAAFHGPDEFAADVARQQELERIGWKFHRISDTDYYLHPQETIDKLVAALASEDIFPDGARPVEEPTVIAAVGIDEIEALAAVPPNIASDPVTAPDQAEAEIAEPESGDAAEPELLQAVSLEPAETERPRPLASPLRGASSGESETLTASASGAVEVAGESYRISGAALVADAVPQPVASLPLEQYEHWVERELESPTHMYPEQAARVFVEVVSVEGPMQLDVLYRLVNKAGGNQRVRARIRTALDAGLSYALENNLLLHDADQSADAGGVVRTPVQEVIDLREPGGRSVHEYPADELAALIEWVRRSEAPETEEELFRSVLAVFGSKKLTQKTTTLLRSVLYPIGGEGY